MSPEGVGYVGITKGAPEKLCHKTFQIVTMSFLSSSISRKIFGFILKLIILYVSLELNDLIQSAS